MWDTKRQIIWLATAVTLGTFFIYPLARDDDGQIDWPYFTQLEVILLVVIAVMFYLYSRNGDKA